MGIWDALSYIILKLKINQDPKQSMIPKQAIRFNHIITSIFRSCPFLTTPLVHSFSKLSDQLRSGSYRSYAFKSSNIRFRSNDLLLLTYFYHPSITSRNDGGLYLYEIKESSALTLSFLADTTEDMIQSAWQNRKSVSLTFREALKLMKLQPLSNETFSIKQLSIGDQVDSPTYTKWLSVTDCSQKEEIQIHLKQTAQEQLTKKEQNLWEIRFAIKYEDYPTFSHSIRNNMLYISGAKFSIEVTKQESLLQLNYVQPQKENLVLKFGKASKEAKTVKKKPGRPPKNA